jgi:hypothetical protein
VIRFALYSSIINDFLTPLCLWIFSRLPSCSVLSRVFAFSPCSGGRSTREIKQSQRERWAHFADLEAVTTRRRRDSLALPVYGAARLARSCLRRGLSSRSRPHVWAAAPTLRRNCWSARKRTQSVMCRSAGRHVGDAEAFGFPRRNSRASRRIKQNALEELSFSSSALSNCGSELEVKLKTSPEQVLSDVGIVEIAARVCVVEEFVFNKDRPFRREIIIGAGAKLEGKPTIVT